MNHFKLTALCLLTGGLWAMFSASGTGSTAPPLAHVVPDASPQEHAALLESQRLLDALPAREPLLRSPFGVWDASADQPADPSARTRGGLYATPAQAQALATQLHNAVAWIEVGCCAEQALALAEGITHGLMAADDLAADAPVFVSGASPQMAAQLADRLSAEGLTRVVVLTHDLGRAPTP